MRKIRGLTLRKLCPIPPGPGIYYGDVDITGAAGQDSITMDTRLMQYPAEDQEAMPPPLSMVLTEFHVLILFNDRQVVFHILLLFNDRQVVFHLFILLNDRQGLFHIIILFNNRQVIFHFLILFYNRQIVFHLVIDKGLTDRQHLRECGRKVPNDDIFFGVIGVILAFSIKFTSCLISWCQISFAD